MATRTPQTELVLAVARARSAFSRADSGSLWRGTYGGRSPRGCDRVRLQLASQSAHTWHYLVCGGVVRELNDVAPRPPSDRRMQAIFEPLLRTAWRTGRGQRLPYAGYEMEVEPAGLASRGCAPVDWRLVWQDMLVEAGTELVCGR